MCMKRKSFSGGYRFSNLEGGARKEIAELQIPPKVIIPFKQGPGTEVTPIVKPGENVKAGQIIGINDESISNPVHSSVNGKVEEILNIQYFNGTVAAAVISTDGTYDWQPLEQYECSWKALTPDKIEKLLYLSGAASLGKNGIPTRYKSSDILPDKVRNIIIKGVSSEPYNLSPSVLFQNDRLSDFAEGIEILHAVIPKAKIHLAFDKDEEWIQGLEEKIGDFEFLDLYPFIPKYPQGNDEILVSSILGKSLPYGISAADEGIIVLDFQAVLQARDAVAEGKPVFERIIALSGSGWKDSVHLKFRIGTTVEYITSQFLKNHGKNRLIFDALLTNEPVMDFSFPVGRAFSQLIAVPENTSREKFSFLRAGRNRYSYSKAFLSVFDTHSKRTCDTNIHGEERPCMFCGFCEEVCPVGIIPHVIDKYADKGILDERLVNYGVFNCMGCNLCSFVCPSKIHLGKHIREAQKKMELSGYKQPAINNN